MSLRKARELLCIVIAQADNDKFRGELQLVRKAGGKESDVAANLDTHWSSLTRIAPLYGYCNTRAGLWTAVQHALWVARCEGDAPLLQQRLREFGFEAKAAPKPRLVQRRKRKRPPIETFLFRNCLGPTRWTSEAHLPDPGSETDTEDEARNASVVEKSDPLLGLGTSSADSSVPARRIAHGAFGAAQHPKMLNRREQQAEQEMTCELELTPIHGVGECLQLFTRPTCYLYFYSNAQQPIMQRSGYLPPCPTFAIGVSCPSGSKRKGRAEWDRLKMRLLPLLKRTAFMLIYEGRYLLPRVLLPTPAYPLDCYHTPDGIVTLKPGEYREFESLEVDAPGDNDCDGSATLDECYAMLKKQGKRKIDLEDFGNLEDLERLQKLVRETKRDKVGIRIAQKEFWQRDAQLEANKTKFFKAVEARESAAPTTADDSADDVKAIDTEATVWKRMGQRAFGWGDFFTAYAHYTAELGCLRKLPEDDSVIERQGVAYSNRSACLAKVRDFEEALADATQATQKRPKWGRAWSRLGIAASSLGPRVFEVAEKAWRRAVELEPCAMHVDGLMVVVRQMRGQVGTANADKEDGNQAARIKEWGKAIACYTTGLAKLPFVEAKVQGKKAPRDDHALMRAILYANRSAAFVRSRLFKEACADAEQAIEVKEDFAQAYCRLGVAQLASGQHTEAYLSFSKAKALDENAMNFRVGRENAMALIPLWECPSSIRRRGRFLRDSHRDPSTTKIFAISDVHYDHPGNEEWVHSISSTRFLDDILIVAGNVADARRPLLKGLTALRAKFRRVFYMPGNHEMWIHPSEKEKFPDSLCKLWSILQACDELDIDVTPAAVGTGLFICPLFSWYSATFDIRDPFPNPKLEENKHCKWPIDAEHQVWRYMLSLNRQSLEKPYHGNVITFSHFAPRTCCPIHGGKGLEKMSGCLELDDQVREAHSSMHFYGHTHRKFKMTEDGVFYVHNHLGFETEHMPMEPIMCVWNGRSITTEITPLT